MGWTKGKSRKGQGAGRGRGGVLRSGSPAHGKNPSTAASRNKARQLGITHSSLVKRNNDMMGGRIGKLGKQVK